MIYLAQYYNKIYTFSLYELKKKVFGKLSINISQLRIMQLYMWCIVITYYLRFYLRC